MPDTPRTLNKLYTALFQEGQPDGAITPQDMRDLILSIGQVPFGGIYTLVTSETVISSVGVYTKALGTTQVSNLRAMDMPVDNRLRYTGVVPYHIHIAISISMKAAGNNKLLSFLLSYHDDSAGTDTQILGSRVNRFVSVGADEGSTALHWDLVMETNDYLELHVTNLTDSVNLTVTNFYMFGTGELM